MEAFYLQRVISPAPDGWPLVLTFDGKGIVMLPGALRPATAKAAAAAEGKLATRLSPGEKNGRKRMAELACVYDAVPVPRTPGDIISTPAQKRRKKKAQAAEAEGQGEAAGAAGAGQVADRLGHRRHPRRHRRRLRRGRTPRPRHKRDWVVLIDGNNTQIEAVTAEAASRGITVTIVIDFIHVLEYLWKAAWSFFDKGEPAAEEWVADQARKILHGKSAQVAAGIRRRATTYGYSGAERAGADECARYLDNKKDYLDYATALGEGLAHRHRDHRGRLQAHRQGQNGHNGRKMGTRRRRGHPQAPRPHRQRRLRGLLALPPPPRARTHPPRQIPRRPHPRSVTSSPQKSRTVCHERREEPAV